MNPAITEGQERDRNNQNHNVDPEADLATFSSLSELEMKNLLRKNQALHGFLVDDNFGPVRSSYQVAVCKDGRYYSPTWIREGNDADIKIVNTKTERDSNYAHRGWLPAAVYTTSPWAVSRTTHRNIDLSQRSWITKQIIVQHLRVKIPKEDLKPNPDFENEVEAALSCHSKAESIQAVYKALCRWGDVVPLEFDFGISFIITDLEQNMNHEPTWWGMHVKLSSTARFSTVGGTISEMEHGFGRWANQNLSPHEWRICRVVGVLPTVKLLNRLTQDKLDNLHSEILSFIPSPLDGPLREGEEAVTWDDSPYAFKTIHRVNVSFNDRVFSLSFVYTDGSQSEHYAGTGIFQHTFTLEPDEHISQVLIWSSLDALYGIQFMTTANRTSLHYGVDGGTPILICSHERVLAGFMGRRRTRASRMSISHLQAIWRYNQTPRNYGGGRQYAEYVGGPGGSPFNDLTFSGSLTSTYISCIEVQSNDKIVSIQCTYMDKSSKDASSIKAPLHGGPGASKIYFTLDPDEYIVCVGGMYGTGEFPVLEHLSFTTNKERVSGGISLGDGTYFVREPRTPDGRRMRLFAIGGKCSRSAVDGLLLIWIPS